MVKVSNRRRCQTCRRKKIKCDEQSPRCGQCRRGALLCEQYDSSNSFVNHTSASFASSIREHPSSGRAPGLVLQAEPQASKGFVDIFLDQCLPPASISCSLSWLRDLWCNDDRRNSVAGMALVAVATGWIGQSNGHQHLARQGFQIYTAVISDLRRTVSSMEPLDVFVIAALLILYELIQFGSGNSSTWRHHLAGAAEALHSTVGNTLTEDPYVHAFFFCQSIFVIEGLRGKSRSCLAMPRSIGLEYSQTMKSHVGYTSLINIGTEAADVCLAAMGHDETNIDDMETLDRFISLLRRLRQWRPLGLNLIHPETFQPVEQPFIPKGVDLGIKGPLEPASVRPGEQRWHSYEYTNDVRLLLLYYTIRLAVLHTLLSLQARQLPDPVCSSIRGDSSSTRTNFRLLADTFVEGDEICIIVQDLVDVCLDSPWSSLGNLLEDWAVEVLSMWDGHVFDKPE